MTAGKPANKTLQYSRSLIESEQRRGVDECHNEQCDADDEVFSGERSSKLADVYTHVESAVHVRAEIAHHEVDGLDVDVSSADARISRSKILQLHC